MTFSILVRDAQSNAIAGAAATGSLCVGGWVLRGRWGVGMSASQGAAPSTMWGESVLERMAAGEAAPTAVRAVTAADPGRDWRQLAVLSAGGEGAFFTGELNTDAKAGHVFEDGVASGNMLSGEGVPEALAAGYGGAEGALPDRLLAGLRAAQREGGDMRGLLSAAILVLRPDAAPLSLRVDHAEDPLAALGELIRRATTGHYADWAAQVPSLQDPFRGLKE